MITPDAIIVGSGAGGGTAADALTRRGFTVCVLEKGPLCSPADFLPYDELHFGELSPLQRPGDDDPGIYVRPDGTTSLVSRWWIANMVGGSTMIWEANLSRYSQEDFALLDVMGNAPTDCSIANWPWQYAEFEPFFEEAERRWGVSGAVNQSPHQEPFRKGYEYPMPPLVPHGSTSFLTGLFNRAGMHPYIGPRGINSRTYDSRPACPFCGFCQRFGCSVNDRASSYNSVLRRALDTGRCTLLVGHCVTRLLWDRGRVTGVAFKTAPGEPERVLTAPIVIVSVQAIESARLFLHSGVPDPSGLTGRFLTYHTKGTLEAVFPNREPWPSNPRSGVQPAPGLGSLQLRDYYRIHDKVSGLTKGGKFSLYDPYTTMTPLRLALSSGLTGAPLVAFLAELRDKPGVGLSLTAESLPRFENRVELDPQITDPWGVPVARTYYQHHDYDLSVSNYCLDAVGEVLTNAGARITKRSPQTAENEGYGHNHGTLRAGTEPDSSVLTVQCESHTVQGLYVLDAAWMPTSGASNPTLTLIANAYRVCSQIPKPDH